MQCDSILPGAEAVHVAFFDDGKTVFINPATACKNLRSDMKLIFYQSHEATIRQIIIAGDPLAFFDTYGDAVFLTRDEAATYRSEQEKWEELCVQIGGKEAAVDCARTGEYQAVRAVGEAGTFRTRWRKESAGVALGGGTTPVFVSGMIAR